MCLTLEGELRRCRIYSRDKGGCLGLSETFLNVYRERIGVMSILRSRDPSDVLNGNGSWMQYPYLGRESGSWVEPEGVNKEVFIIHVKTFQLCCLEFIIHVKRFQLCCLEFAVSAREKD